MNEWMQWLLVFSFSHKHINIHPRSFFVCVKQIQTQYLINVSCEFTFLFFPLVICSYLCPRPQMFCMSYLADMSRSLLNYDATPAGLCCWVETGGSLSEWRWQLHTGRSVFGQSQPEALGREYRCFKLAATMCSFCYCVYFSVAMLKYL